MSKLFPTQEIGSLKKPADMLKKVKDPNVSDEEKIKARNDAALLNIKTLEDIGLDIVYDGEVRRVEMYEEPVRYVDGFEFAGVVVMSNPKPETGRFKRLSIFVETSPKYV